jgi:Photosynthetic reaction centre cytochrome C subunit
VFGPASAQGDVQTRMREWATALGVECVHCHVPDQWTDAAKPTFDFGRRMSRMVAALNEGVLKDIGDVAASLGVDCSHCHETDRSLNTRTPKSMVAKMRPIFDEIPKHFDASVRAPLTQCYLCHQGRVNPERHP